MKKSTKWITAAAATLALSASLAIAAPSEGRGFGHEGGRQEHAAKLAAKLNLSDAQKTQWEAMRQSFKQDNAAFFQQARQTMQDFRAAKKAGDTAKADALKPQLDAQRAQMKQLRDAQDQKLSAILNADQRAQFDALKAERAQRHAEHEHGKNN